MDCVVSPVDQLFPEAAEEVSVMLPPEQKVVDPLAEMVGTAGRGFTVTVVDSDGDDWQVPLVTDTE